jgi:hypothetical protein
LKKLNCNKTKIVEIEKMQKPCWNKTRIIEVELQ